MALSFLFDPLFAYNCVSSQPVAAIFTFKALALNNNTPSITFERINKNPNDSSRDADKWVVVPGTFVASCAAQTDSAAQQAVDECIAKAMQLLHDNVTNDSMYLMFEWNSELNTLTVQVTDPSKSIDGPFPVVCAFTWNESLPERGQAETAELVQYWIKDYLTTCSEFYNYSLVAVFHRGDRSKTVLL